MTFPSVGAVKVKEVVVQLATNSSVVVAGIVGAPKLGFAKPSAPVVAVGAPGSASNTATFVSSPAAEMKPNKKITEPEVVDTILDSKNADENPENNGDKVEN